MQADCFDILGENKTNVHGKLEKYVNYGVKQDKACDKRRILRLDTCGKIRKNMEAYVILPRGMISYSA